jgi:hypothetical protein
MEHDQGEEAMRHITRTSVGTAALTLACSAAGLSVASQATADSAKNMSVIDGVCSNGQTVQLSLTSQGAFPSSLHVVSSTSNFTLHQITLTPHDGSDPFTVKNSSGVDNNKTLIDCSHDGNSFLFTWTGFFTPAK